ACCYLLDRAAGEFRLELFNDAAGDLASRLWRADLPAPASLPLVDLSRALQPMIACGAPGEITDRRPEFLPALRGDALADAIARMIGVSFVATAPVHAAGKAAGVVVLMVVHDWPVDVAAECTAHAAVALANLFERRDVEDSVDRDDATGLLTRA